MKRLLAAIAVIGVAGVFAACGGASGSAEEGEVGAVHLALIGGGEVDIDGNLAIIAIQSVFGDESYLIECQRKDHLSDGYYGSPFCDELQVLPPGVYEVIVQSPDPNCRTEKDHYKVLVEPNETTEIEISLVCGIDNGAVDTIVKETYRPVIEDVNFSFGEEVGNKFICNDVDPEVVPPPEYVRLIEVELSDEDTSCGNLKVTFASEPAGLIFSTPQPVIPVFESATGKCIASFKISASGVVPGVYDLTITVTDDPEPDPYTTELTIPIHVLDCYQ